MVAAGCEPLPAPSPVTMPNGTTPRESASPMFHGNNQLWTALSPAGTVVFHVMDLDAGSGVKDDRVDRR